ncbi:hypothetical protein FGO68_gene2882 [Halteria grandinella]|uniref:Uncharacterized protein n=1 Tax=Halteria grandinella TaxID=5974 RepID=A0A8J8NDH2_HALGN|nr:hypothetical protein FGO68_gene2882 [Halteria grandinella]
MKLIFLALAFTSLTAVDAVRIKQERRDNGPPLPTEERPSLFKIGNELAKIRSQKNLAEQEVPELLNPQEMLEKEIAEKRGSPAPKMLAQKQGKGYEPVNPGNYIDYNDPYYQSFDSNADYHFNKDEASNDGYDHGYMTGVNDGMRIYAANYDYESYFNLNEEVAVVDTNTNWQKQPTEYYYYYDKEGKLYQYGEADFDWNKYYAATYYYTDKYGKTYHYNDYGFTWYGYYCYAQNYTDYCPYA